MYLKVLMGDKYYRDGDLHWSLPKDGQPGDWHEVEGGLEPHENGLHFTDDANLGDWLKLGCQVYEIEPTEIEWTSEGRHMSRKARLIREIPLPMWWQAGTEFLRHAQAMTFFDNHEQPNPEWRVFDTREIAIQNAQKQSPGYLNYILRQVNGEILDASRRVKKDSVDKAFEGLQIITNDESTSVDVALYVKKLMLEVDLSQSSKEYIERRWDIYKRGYGCAGDVDDVFYVYKTQPLGVRNINFCSGFFKWQVSINDERI